MQPISIRSCVLLGESCVSYRSVANWIHEFRQGRDSVEDAPRIGRPVTEATPVNIETVRQLIDSHPRISIRYIIAEIGLTLYTIQNIIANYLHMKKLCSRWVPHF